MCGRYSLITDLGELALQFEFDRDLLKFEPAYNVAPTQNVLTVLGGETRRGGFMRWGLIPHWAKNASIGSRMINARAETVAEKPAFRDALRRRRCLVLADGFYEWQRTGTGKRPMRIVLRTGEPFAFAGLWSSWRDPEGNSISSCAIITTTANDLLQADSRPNAGYSTQGYGRFLAGWELRRPRPSRRCLDSLSRRCDGGLRSVDPRKLFRERQPRSHCTDGLMGIAGSTDLPLLLN